MTQFKTTAVGLLMLLALPVFAQLQKGNYSFGGDVSLMGALQKNDYINANALNASLSPSVSKFLTDKWQMGVRPILSYDAQTHTAEVTTDKTKEQRFTSLGLEVSSRYYVKKWDKIALFGDVKASFQHGMSYGSILGSSSEFIEDKKADNFFNYQIGIGAALFLNKEVAFETTLSYLHTELPLSSGSFTSATNQSGSSLALEFKMNNFISFAPETDKTDNSETPQYLAQGRQTLNFNGWFGKKDPNVYSNTRANKLAVQYSYCLTDNWQVLGDLDYTGKQFFLASVATRYNIPVKERFFLYPELRLAYIASDGLIDNFSSYPYYDSTVGLGFGGSYFLSKHIALDATILQVRYVLSDGYSRDKTLAGLIGFGNVGLRYFIR